MMQKGTRGISIQARQARANVCSLDKNRYRVKSSIYSSTIHSMDTKRIDLNLLVTLEALLA